LLLEHQADPNAVDDSEATPLHVAVSKSHLDVAKLFVSRGTKPDTQVLFFPFFGKLFIISFFSLGCERNDSAALRCE